MEEKDVELRFGWLASRYEERTGVKSLKQLDLLERWFPGLIVQEEVSDGHTKTDAEYADMEYLIHAVRVNGRLYTGNNGRVTQIMGRLIGTARGNKEKERRSANLIQKHVADQFIRDMELAPKLQQNADELIGALPDDAWEQWANEIPDILYTLARKRYAMTDYERKTELFAMDDEVFDGIIYNAAYQWTLDSEEGLRNSWLWLLTGGLLRNEAGRITRVYDSSFIAVNRQRMDETGTLLERINALFHPEQYYDVYSGDDLDKRFPGIEWYCDKCGAHLNEQEGFDDHLDQWQCRKCGTLNPIALSEIYSSAEDIRNQRDAGDPDRFNRAISVRQQELNQKPDK